MLSQLILPVGEYELTPWLPESFLSFIIDADTEPKKKEMEKVILPETIDLESRILYLRNLKDLKTFARVKRVDVKKYGKSIIVDPYTFYYPYHLDLRSYGIYFRAKNIIEDFLEFAALSYLAIDKDKLAFLGKKFPDRWLMLRQLLRNLNAFIASFFVVFAVFSYFHALTHHIIEDISTYLEGIKKAKYSPIKRDEEEEFCVWVSFRALESYKIPEILYQSKKVERILRMFYPILPKVPREDIIDVTQFAIPLLYCFFVYRNSVLPKPRISRKVSKLFSVIWEPMRVLHFTYEHEPVKINDIEIFERLFVTTY